jgi:hypothetical protein
MSTKPEPPLACSLSATDAKVRQGAWDELLRRAALKRAPVTGGMRVEFRPDGDVRDRLTRLVELERECCPFLELTIDETGDGRLALTATGPPDAEPIVRELLAPR